MSTPDNLVNPSPVYDLNLPRFTFMRRQGPTMPVTENYVAVPPALWIREEVADGECVVWTLGYDYNPVEWLSGRWEYDCIRDGVKTGEYARVIEKRNNSRGVPVIRIFGSEGWKTWSGKQFV
jgi:hypothetical protein